MDWLIDPVNNIVTAIQSAYTEPDFSLHVIISSATFTDVKNKISALKTHFASAFSFTFEYS
jgi:hypothetical protein